LVKKTNVIHILELSVTRPASKSTHLGYVKGRVDCF